MTSRPKTIAVCITSYNQREYLRLAIESVLAQTRLPDQIIVADDASTDGSIDVLNEFDALHPGVFTIVLANTNMGIGVNRYKGVSASTCDLTTCLDGDDLFLPEKLELEEQCLHDRPDAGIVYSNIDMIDGQGAHLWRWTDFADQPLPEGDLIEIVATMGFPRELQLRSPLAPTGDLRDACAHAKDLKLYEDVLAMLYLTRRHRAAFVPDVNLGYRLHDRGAHRARYDRHFQALVGMYSRAEPLFADLDPIVRSRIHRSRDRLLSKYAWRGVREYARSTACPTRGRSVQLAREAIRLDIKTLRPWHVTRVLKAEYRSAMVAKKTPQTQGPGR